jgi:predicted RNA-binding Zn-ribbon protein involved in translation (DUF1610 family)
MDRVEDTIVRATCPTCGDVEMPLTSLSLRVCADDGRGTYGFSCPTCGERVVKEAEGMVVGVLLASGVDLAWWELPDELDEPHHGPALTHDDLLDFHLLLEQPDWFARLAASVTP